MEIVNDKIPSNIIAEKIVLGVLLVDNDRIPAVTSLLTPESFYLAQHKLIFKAITEIHMQGCMANIVGVIEWLKKKRALRKIGGDNYLKDLTKPVSDSDKEAVEFYAHTIGEKYVLRKIIATGRSIAIKGYDGVQSPEQLVRELQESAEGLSKSLVSKDFDLKIEVSQAVDELEEFAKDGSTRMVTGYKDVDKLMGSIKRKRVYMMGALPSMGKTTFLLSIMRYIAEHGHLPFYFTAEMSNRELLYRMMQNLTLVPNYKFENSKLMEESDWKKVFNAAQKLDEMSFILNDNCYNISSMYPLVEKYKPDVVFVDFIDAMDFGGVVDLAPRIAKAVADFKRMAKQLDTAVFIASQMSRTKEGSIIDTYQLSDLKGSGGKEIGADVVFFIHHPWQDRKSSINPYTGKEWVSPKDEKAFYVLFKKNKFGELGRVMLFFDRKTGIFKSWSFREEG